MTLSPTLQDRQLLPLLPVIYVAGADGELSADEMDSLCAHIDAIDGIDVECREAVHSWLGGSNPPRPGELGELLAVVLRLAGGLEHPEQMDPATLAAQLVHTGCPGIPLRAPEARAIAEPEAVLGIIGSEATTGLLDLTREAASGDEAPAFDRLVMGAFRRDARALVDAFFIPDAVLAAPISR